LAGLLDVMGDRMLVVASASERGTQVLWRGTIGKALEQPPPSPLKDPRVLVVEGARGPAARWDEERLRGEVQARLEKGLGAKQVSQQLAAESGWPRRDVYRLAVEASQRRGNE
jgi:16S rRNA C1402 (ribose-2'-O) methylase RsmI